MIDRAAPRLLIADSDKAIRRLLRVTSAHQGYYSDEAYSLDEAVECITRHRPNILLLDLSFGEAACIRLIDSIRQWSTLPILILSVEDDESLKVRLLDAGADDYVVKPFGIDELMARIRAALRRNAVGQTGLAFVADEIAIDWAARLVTRCGKIVHLTPIEYAILEVLAGNAGKIVTHRHIMEHVWGTPSDDAPQLLRVHIRNLRTKLETTPAQPKHIITLPGIGYRFCESQMQSPLCLPAARPQFQIADTTPLTNI